MVAPGGERRQAWWALAQIGRRLGIEALGRGVDPDAADDTAVLGRLAARSRRSFAELVAAGPHGLGTPVSVGWYHEHVLPGGRWRLAPPELLARLDSPDPPPLVLTPRRQVRNMNSTAYGTADDVLVELQPRRRGGGRRRGRGAGGGGQRPRRRRRPGTASAPAPVPARSR